jgi:hypothetical protein
VTGDLPDRAAELELELATLEAEIEAFRSDYLRAVGVLVAEYHEAEARIADLGADPVARAAARERSRQSRADLGSIPPTPPRPPSPPTDELKALFRRAAKAMHPDLAPDAGTRGHAEAFMKRLTDAYRRGDVDAIADLLAQWRRAGRAEHPMDASRAQAVVADAERRLAALRASEFARLLEESLAASLRGEDLLAQLQERWTVALADARARLAAVTP